MRLLLDLQGAQGMARGSGLGRYTLELARAIVAQAADPLAPLRVEVLINQGAEAVGELTDEFAARLGRGAVHLWVPPAGITGRDPEAPLRLAAERIRAARIAEIAPDVLHSGSLFEGFEDAVVTTWPADLARPATAATLHDLIPLTHRALYLDAGHDAGWGEAGRRPWYLRCLREAIECDLLLANSEATRREALSQPAFWPGAIAVVGGGVAGGFAPVPLEEDTLARLRGRYGLPPGAVLFLGAGDHRKNHQALIAAYATLPEALRQRHPLAIGHARPQEMDGLGLAEAQFLRLPRIAEEDLPAVYSAAALLAFPSLAEGFGLPVLEAMACGCPVIAGDVSALPEVLGRADALFDPRDPADIARLLRRALQEEDWRAELSLWGQRRAREFSWEGVAARTIAAMTRLAPRRTALALRPRLALLSATEEAALPAAGRLGATHAVTLVTETVPRDAVFRRIGWGGLGSVTPPFDRILHLGDDLPEGLTRAHPGLRFADLRVAPEASPAAWSTAIDLAMRQGARAAVRAVADVPLDEAGLDAAVRAIAMTWPRA
jgi:glycosyltransferase involved in cell wall biosynthesis